MFELEVFRAATEVERGEVERFAAEQSLLMLLQEVLAEREERLE